MMPSALLNLPQQFSYVPILDTRYPIPDTFFHVIVAGMGGSHLAADLLTMLDPTLSLTVHSDYGLPYIPPEQKSQTWVIASSYSGNTEETLDAYATARAEGLQVAAIAVGGKLIELAKQDSVPFIQLPNTGIQPRSALGFNLVALLTLLDKQDLLAQARKLAVDLHPATYQEAGRTFAANLRDRIPIIYASRARAPIAENWKIKFNETAKIPAFSNVIPELNHNEMTSFDHIDTTKNLSERFSFIFLRDETDHSRVQRRFEVMAKLYRDRGLPVHELHLEGASLLDKTFASLLLADWTAVALAEYYGVESEQVPMVEEFKHLL